MADTPQTESRRQPIGEEEPPRATKKIVSLSGRKRTPQKPPPESTDKELFRERHSSLCSHITARDYDSPDDIFEATSLLLSQIQSLFSALGALNEGGDETHNLCMLGEDLAAEAQNRLHRFYDEA